MTSAPLVSVCIPTYKPSGYLHQAAHSVVAQTYPNIELIVVDDASTPAQEYLAAVASLGSPEPSSAEAALTREVRVIRCPNHLGIPGHWNRALQYARGELVQVFHQDDLMDPDYLARVVELFGTYPSAGFAFSNVLLIDDEGMPKSGHWLPQGLPGETRLLHSGELLDRLTRFGNIVSCPSVVAKAEVWRQAALSAGPLSGTPGLPDSASTTVGGRDAAQPAAPADGPFRPQLAYAADLELWLRLAATTNAIYLAEPMISQRRHADQTSARFEGGVAEVDELASAYRLGLLEVPAPFHEAPRLYRQALDLVRQRASKLARRALARGRLVRAGQLWGWWRALRAAA